MEKNQNPIDAFHAHLDECCQCRNNAFNLCPVGYQLLKQAAEGSFFVPDNKEIKIRKTTPK